MSIAPSISPISRVPNALTLPKSIFHDAYPRRYSKLSISPLLHGSLSHCLSISQYLDISLSQVFIARAFSFKNEKSAKNPKILALFCCILFFHPDPTYVLGETLQYAHWLSLSSGDIVSFSLSTRKRTLRSMLLSLYL